MKVLRMISSLDPQKGGPGQGIRNIIPELEILGVINEVVCLDSEEANFVTKSSFPVHTLGRAKNAWHYHPELIHWLLNHLSLFDVVIVHGLWLYHSYAVFKALKILQEQGKQIPKMYIMPHGMLDPWFQRDSTRRIKAIRNEIYWAFIERNVINSADGLLFTCQTELELARTTFWGYQPRKEINVGYGITAPPPFSDSQKTAFFNIVPQLKNNPYLLFLSRIHPKKGIDLMLKAYKQILANELQRDLPHIVVAGPGIESEYGKYIKTLVDTDNNLQKKVHFVGMLSGDAKWGAFYGSEAFILPSHQENFGIAVVEAMACKKPVLISNQVNIWKEIEDGQGGIIAPDTEDGVKQQLMVWLSLSDDKKATMGQNAYLTYKKHFSVEEAAKKLASVLLATAKFE